MKKLLAGMLALCLLLALSACRTDSLPEANQTYPDGMADPLPPTEPEIDFGDIDFEFPPTIGNPMEDI